MGRRRRLLIGVAFLSIGAIAALAQAPANKAADALPASVVDALNAIRDSSFDFDQPGFFAVVEYLKTHPAALRDADAAPIPQWQALIERPRDFRGQVVTVEGVVGRNSSWQFRTRPELGTLWQLELHQHADQAVACTVILTADATDIPIDATIRVSGYFVAARQYISNTKQVRPAPLIVAQGPSLITAAPRQPAARSRDGTTIALVSVVGGALVAWLMLRHSASRGRTDLKQVHSRGPAPQNLSAELSDWAGKGEGDDH